jgi:L-alanine-DL-glutamate epimerase-like enolase superfamily enzyme
MMTPMKFRHLAFHLRLKFRHAFHIAHGERTHTDTVFVKINNGQHIGFGEAALPPYLGYSPLSIVAEINHYVLPELSFQDQLTRLHKSNLSKPARTAIDSALHDLWGKTENKPVYNLLNLQVPESNICFYTLGISDVQALEEKLADSTDIQVYKIKLGGENDHAFLKEFRKRSTTPFCADANQAWKSKETALAEINRLYDLGCLFIEQPLPVGHPDLDYVFKNSKLPIYLDESIQSLADINANAGKCHGINLKLLKSGGIQPALEWINTARSLGLEVLIGCMSESSCGAAAALQLCGASRYVDLDGPLLITNDPFGGLRYENGRIYTSDSPGTGVHERE